jgi:oligoribonuclease NrnB/cAMP/cGMP phosphodiesterase (DHH superfamily)
MPRSVKLIADYDTWRFEFEHTKAFHYGVQSIDTDPDSSIWSVLFFIPSAVDEIIDNGLIIQKYITTTNKEKVNHWAYEAEFEGYSCICHNGSGGSLVYDSISKDYDLKINYVHDGQQFTVSIYTTKEIDVSELAKKHGGGGHKKAAGFQTKELPLTFKCKFN